MASIHADLANLDGEDVGPQVVNQFATTVITERIMTKVDCRYGGLGFEKADYTVCT